MSINIGLYGMNGHQIQGLFKKRPEITLAAICDFPPQREDECMVINPSVKRYRTLSQMLEDDSIRLISLCSRHRRDQAAEAIRCMEAGKHVYAEKPCAMTEKELDDIVNTSVRTGCSFHEMAGTGFEQPYLTMRSLILAGTIGEVVQVLAQKSYPHFKERPQDENIDGGLLMQVGVHAMRL